MTVSPLASVCFTPVRRCRPTSAEAGRHRVSCSDLIVPLAPVLSLKFRLLHIPGRLHQSSLVWEESPQAARHRPQAARRSPLAARPELLPRSLLRIALLHGCNRHCFNGQRLALDIIRLQQKAANTGGICSNRKSTVYLYIYKYMKTVLFISLQRDNCSHPRVG